MKVGSLEQSEVTEGSGSDEISDVQQNVVSEEVRVAPISRTTTTTTTTTTTPTTTTTTQTTTTTEEPGIVEQIVNGISNGVGRLATNVFTGAGFAAAAASPLWAPLLVGKKRRRRQLMRDDEEYELKNKIMNFENNVLKKLKV